MLQLKRKQEIRQVAPAVYVKQRIADVAAVMSMTGKLAERVEVANEALCRLAQVLYERDTDGIFANVDEHTGRLLIPAPWGSKGWRKWKLPYHEALKLRKVLLTRQRNHKSGLRPPLFVYDTVSHRWYINLEDYPTFAAAMFWLKGDKVCSKEWR